MCSRGYDFDIIIVGVNSPLLSSISLLFFFFYNMYLVKTVRSQKCTLNSFLSSIVGDVLSSRQISCNCLSKHYAAERVKLYFKVMDPRILFSLLKILGPGYFLS